ncbi:MAG TPA: hypothetical protein VMU48_16180 [Terracidiphilus sp.]|nr:hypothetical protein [Terracidiphilus sp.]
MKTGTALTYAIAAMSIAFLSPNLARASAMRAKTAQSAGDSNAAMAANSTQLRGEAEAKEMVPARAAVTSTLDANKLKPGDPINVKLADTVHLKNGRELPNGTRLIGVVSTDNMHPGNSKLAIRFTEAKLKHGGTVPIKATIVGVFPPETENGQGYDVVAGDQQPNGWTDSTLQVDQIGALSGVDLHSRIAGTNSGVFVTTKKSDVKLDEGSELTLAIGAANNRQTAMNGSGM